MKRFRKGIIMILVVMLLVGMTGAFAATTTNPEGYDYKCYDGYKTYMCIGDSIAAGYTVSGIYMDPVGLGFQRVTGAYHDLVATGINADLLQMGCSAFRCVELRYILDGFYSDTDGIWNMAFAQAFSLENLDALRPYYIGAIQASDIITINLGSNDILSYSYIRAMIKMYEDNTSDAQKAVKAWIEENGGDVGQAFLNMLGTAQSIGKLPAILAEFVSAFNEAFNKYKQDWNAALKAIYELNPDVQIITVGVYNPANNISITEGGSFKVGPFMQPFVDQINNFLKSGHNYAKQCPFADVTGTETWPISVTGGDFTTKYNWCSHPTRAGHMYMAAKIMEVIPNRYADEEPTVVEPTTTEPTTVDPTVPVEPTTPTEPADPTTPTEPADPTTPTEPADPTTPTEPADPTTPTERADPADPTEPVEPTEPTNTDPTTTDPTAADPTTADPTDTTEPCDGGKDCPSIQFTDVDRGPDSWYHFPVDWAVVNEITNGTSETTFSPMDGCKRAQVVTFLWRAANQPEPKTGNNPFSDVSKDEYYYKAVLWAVENGITKGTSETTFSPDDTCTREQVVTFLYRFAEEPEVKDVTNPFKDVSADDYSFNAILWAVSNEVTKGRENDAFAPKETCRRAEVVTFLYRAIAE